MPPPQEPAAPTLRPVPAAAAGGLTGASSRSLASLSSGGVDVTPWVFAWSALEVMKPIGEGAYGRVRGWAAAPSAVQRLGSRRLSQPQ